MNSSTRKRLRLISLRENGPAIKAGFTKTVNAASPASCHIKSRSKFSPIKKPFVAVSTGTSCYQSRSKSGCFFEPCSLCTRYAPDAWIPMDASFKQYTYSDGMDLQQAVPLDAAALISAAGQGAQVNEAEGWVQHLNTAALQGQLSAYQQRLKAYIDRQNGGQSTVGQVLGQRAAQIDPLPFFAATLPYEVKARI